MESGSSRSRRVTFAETLSVLAALGALAALCGPRLPARAATSIAPSELGGQVLYAERCAACHTASVEQPAGAGAQATVVVGIPGARPALTAPQIVLIASYLRTREPNAGTTLRTVTRPTPSRTVGGRDSGDCEACHAAAVQSAWRLPQYGAGG